MAHWTTYFAEPAATEPPAVEQLNTLIDRCPWFTAARRARRAVSAAPDRRLALTDPWRTPWLFGMPDVDGQALVKLSAEDIIDRFLREEDLRIVAEEDTPEIEVCTQVQFDEEDDLVSEELAAIYLAQGLSDRAIAIYRKLSLRNPEKSVYFAELIGQIENNN